MRDGFAWKTFNHERGNLLDRLESFWNIAVIAELPCGKQFFDEFTPRKFISGVHGEPGRLEVVPCIEQETPVFVTGNNGGLA